MSTTLQTLRRNIGLRTGQPFFTEYGGVGTATGGSTTTLVDTVLLIDADDRWNQHYVYRVADGQTRKITDFAQSSNTITMVAMTTGFSASDIYEIWSTFSPLQVHRAINDALRDAWPFFFTYQEKFLVIQNDVGTAYTLSNLSPVPKRLLQVQIEIPATSITGQVTDAVAQNRLKDTNTTFTSADVGREIRIYDGTSQGDIRTVSALIDANTIEMSSNFTTTLDTTSLYRLVAVEDEAHGYTKELAWSVNAVENPTTLRLGSHPYGYEGYTLRLLYEAEFAALSADADTTTCPPEYLELAAMARLYLIKLTHAPTAELDTWQAAHKAFTQAAQAYIQKAKFQHFNSSFIDDQAVLSRTAEEYPF